MSQRPFLPPLSFVPRVSFNLSQLASDRRADFPVDFPVRCNELVYIGQQQNFAEPWELRSPQRTGKSTGKSAVRFRVEFQGPSGVNGIGISESWTVQNTIRQYHTFDRPRRRIEFAGSAYELPGQGIPLFTTPLQNSQADRLQPAAFPS